MTTQYTPLLLVYAVSAVLTLVVSIYSVHQYRIGTSTKKTLTISFIGMIVSGVVWSFSRFFELLFLGHTLTRLWIGILYIGLGGGALSLFIFGLAFAGKQELLTRRNIGLLAVIPILMVFLALTNFYHELLWTGEFVTRSGWYGDNIVFFDRTLQPMFYVYLLYTVGLMSTGLYFLLRVASASSNVYRKQMILFTVGATVVVVIGTLWGLDRQPFVPQLFDLTPVGFAIMAVFFGYALFHHQIPDLVPVARDTVIDGMEDAYVVLNQNGKVIDSNPAARELVDINTDWRGRHVREFFEPFSEQYERFRGNTSVEKEIKIRKDGAERHFDLQISPVGNETTGEGGSLVVLREITTLKQRERELREREQELDLLRQVQSRVLRHNIRNDLGVVKGLNEVLVEQLDGQQAEMAETVVSTADDLVAISNKARSVEQLVERDQQPTAFGLGRTLHNLVETHRQQYPDVTFTLDFPEECTVETIPAMELALDNLLENAAEHNDNTDPTVDIVHSNSSRATTVTITDNGPGIPEHELAVLEEGEETDLQHGSGIGLWVIDWTIRNSSASIEFDIGPDGSAVTIHIPKRERSMTIQ